MVLWFSDELVFHLDNHTYSHVLLQKLALGLFQMEIKKGGAFTAPP